MNKNETPPQLADGFTLDLALNEASKPPLYNQSRGYQSETITRTTLTLNQLMENFGPFPDQSALFGLCEDNLPILLDLADPISGSILIVSGPESGKSNLLRSLLWSLIKINNPKDVSFIFISPGINKVGSLCQQPHCLHAFSPYQRESSELIIKLSANVEQRLSGRGRGPAIILAIDDLGYFASEGMDGDVLVFFEWLIKNGPKTQIFTIATVNPNEMSNIHTSIASAFKTRILGTKMGLHPLSNEFIPGKENLLRNQFGLQLKNDFVRFSIPSVSY